MVMTVCLELLFGHHIAEHPWSQLPYQDYNIFAGGVWALLLGHIMHLFDYISNLQRGRQRKRFQIHPTHGHLRQKEPGDEIPTRRRFPKCKN